MAGMIEQNMTQTVQGVPEQGAAITPEVVQENIKMPPKLQNAYDRIVLAGMKIMFSEKTNQMVMKQMQGQGPVS
jgi:hypothetical protein